MGPLKKKAYFYSRSSLVRYGSTNLDDALYRKYKVKTFNVVKKKSSERQLAAREERLNETPVPVWARVPVTINACCSRLPSPSASDTHLYSVYPQLLSLVSLRLSSPLCATLPPCLPLRSISPQFSQACGCLSAEGDSPVIWFSCLPSPPLCSCILAAVGPTPGYPSSSGRKAARLAGPRCQCTV